MRPEVMDSEPYLRISQEIVAQLLGLKSLLFLFAVSLETGETGMVETAQEVTVS